MTAASIGSVLARLPSALAKAHTCAGLTTTTGSFAAAVRPRRSELNLLILWQIMDGHARAP
jgi:hypothetical protein